MVVVVRGEGEKGKRERARGNRQRMYKLMKIQGTHTHTRTFACVTSPTVRMIYTHGLIIFMAKNHRNHF